MTGRARSIGHWLTERASHRLVRVDMRGFGMSEWDPPGFNFDALVSDLEAVIDAAGSSNATCSGFARRGDRDGLCRAASRTGAQAGAGQQLRRRLAGARRPGRDRLARIAAGDESPAAELPPQPARRDVHHALLPVGQPGTDRLAQRVLRDPRAGREHGADDRARVARSTSATNSQNMRADAGLPRRQDGNAPMRSGARSRRE